MAAQTTMTSQASRCLLSGRFTGCSSGCFTGSQGSVRASGGVFSGCFRKKFEKVSESLLHCNLKDPALFLSSMSALNGIFFSHQGCFLCFFCYVGT